MVPGPSRFAVTRVHDIKSAFELFIPQSVERIILDNTNLEGRRVYGANWKELDGTHLHAYMGVLILAGVYRSRDEPTASLWNAETGRAIFRATMSLQTFHIFSRAIRFDNRETRPGRRERDKLAAIRDVWDRWVERLPLIYNPGPQVTVDERLVPFKGRCPFRQYMPNKPENVYPQLQLLQPLSESSRLRTLLHLCLLYLALLHLCLLYLALLHLCLRYLALLLLCLRYLALLHLCLRLGRNVNGARAVLQT
ncbi:hypothetical protein AAFF_G00008060 [Aldrovandia affinis]|uniref:PiggyBac transposable element-derived protein domain-containing protein n=1 Tax=Aldrovandia affinis TaxID=143900 RepID=A0AAD7WZY0_9TELE|nr:hypothetical protein AAFF_G00008060 [Aldrovandia affinis]